MTRVVYLCDKRRMTPGQRLRQARKEARLTVEDLARGMELSASTVRAHENGQNSIKPDVAEAYSGRLQITAEWLLYGRGPGLSEEHPPTREVPWYGTIEEQKWSFNFSPLNKARKYLSIGNLFPEWEATYLFAMTVGEGEELPFIKAGSTVFIEPPRTASVYNGNVVLVAHRQDNRERLILRRVEVMSLSFLRVSADPLGEAAEILDSDSGVEGEAYSFAGVVVATLEPRNVSSWPRRQVAQE